MKGNDIAVGIAVLLGIWAAYAFLTTTYDTEGGLFRIPGSGEINPAGQAPGVVMPDAADRGRDGNNTQDPNAQTPQRNVRIASVNKVFDPPDDRESEMNPQPEDKERIILRAPRGNTEPVNITGWTLTSTVTNESAQIGTAFVIRPGRFGRENIRLAPGARAIITTGDGPELSVWPSGATPFRVTKCSGYLKNYGDHYRPSINTNCPHPKNYLPSSLEQNNACRRTVQQTGSCRTPSVISAEVPAECQEWIKENIHINACRERHRTDDDFLKNEWRLFLDRKEAIWRHNGDTIELRDNAGTVRDTHDDF